MLETKMLPTQRYMKDHFQKLERMYLKANLNQQIYTTTQIEIREGEATIRLEVEDKYFHALNALHGSVYFKLLDDAAFFAVNSIVTDVFVLTTNFNIHLIRPVTQGILTAEGSLRFRSRNLFIGESLLLNDQGKEVAFGSGHFARSQAQLTPELGYE